MSKINLHNWVHVMFYAKNEEKREHFMIDSYFVFRVVFPPMSLLVSHVI